MSSSASKATYQSRTTNPISTLSCRPAMPVDMREYHPCAGTWCRSTPSSSRSVSLHFACSMGCACSSHVHTCIQIHARAHTHTHAHAHTRARAVRTHTKTCARALRPASVKDAAHPRIENRGLSRNLETKTEPKPALVPSRANTERLSLSPRAHPR